MYAIQRAAPQVPLSKGGVPEKSPERVAMEQMEVGDAIVITDHTRVRTARDARYRMGPKKFTVRKVKGEGWQVRRTA